MTSIFRGIFGGRSSGEEILSRFSPVGFTAPGLRGTFANNRFTLSRAPATTGAIADIRSGFAGRAGALRDRAAALLGQRDILTGLRSDLGGVLNRFAGTRGVLSGVRGGLAGVRGGLAGVRDDLTGIREEFAGLRPGLRGLRGDIRGLRAQVRPGVGRLTSARVSGLRDLRRQAVGNVREELSRRRVAGSSFAQSQIAGVEAEFAREEDRIRAESFLTELDATNQLILQELGVFGAEGDIIGAEQGVLGQQADILGAEAGVLGTEAGVAGTEAGIAGAEAGVIGQQISTALQEAGLTDLSLQSLVQAFDSSIAGATAELEQLNLETGLAAGLSQTASQLINANLTAQAQARAAQEVGAANFLADVIGAFIGAGE